MNPEEMEKKIVELEQTNKGILSLLQKIMDPTGKMTLNMTVENLIVNIVGKRNAVIEISTANTDGKIMLCALKDFDQNVIFTPADMSKKLANRGWNIPDGTLRPAISTMMNRGLLVKDGGGYRLPSKVTYTGDALNAG